MILIYSPVLDSAMVAHHLVPNSGLSVAPERMYISFHRSISPADGPVTSAGLVPARVSILHCPLYHYPPV